MSRLLSYIIARLFCVKIASRIDNALERSDNEIDRGVEIISGEKVYSMPSEDATIPIASSRGISRTDRLISLSVTNFFKVAVFDVNVEPAPPINTTSAGKDRYPFGSSVKFAPIIDGKFSAFDVNGTVCRNSSSTLSSIWPNSPNNVTSSSTPVSNIILLRTSARCFKICCLASSLNSLGSTTTAFSIPAKSFCNLRKLISSLSWFSMS